MKISELLNGFEIETTNKHSYNALDEFVIWTTNEEQQLLEKVKKPVKLHTLSERDQFRIQSLIRKSLVTKYGMEDPTVVANEKLKT